MEVDCTIYFPRTLDEMPIYDTLEEAKAAGEKHCAKDAVIWKFSAAKNKFVIAALVLRWDAVARRSVWGDRETEPWISD